MERVAKDIRKFTPIKIIIILTLGLQEKAF